MRRIAVVAVALVLTGCGEKRAVAPTSTPAATREATATAPANAGGPWSPPRAGGRRPLRCPASSSRARWPSRVLRRTDGTFVKLWGRRPRLAEVSAEGRLKRRQELGARKPANVRALACGRGDRLAAAWTESTGAGTARLMLSLGGQPARRIATATAPYYDAPIGAVALSFARDGSLLVAYSVFQRVRAVRVTPDGAVAAPRTLGPAFEITADVVADGDVVAWTTIDAGEERNERRRIYAVRGAGLGRSWSSARARLVPVAVTGQPGTELRLAVAPNGRAALLWGLDRDGDRFSVWAAAAGPGGRFGTPRQVSGNGVPGDVAIRSNGETLAVYRAEEELRARLRFGAAETITGAAAEPVAGFDRTSPARRVARRR